MRSESTTGGPDRTVPLARRTSFRIGGGAHRYREPADASELAALVGALRDERPFILGGGCNTLFPDGCFDRPVISTVRLRAVETDANTVRVACGLRIGTLIGMCIERGLGGLEPFVGIPGTVGGAVAMNAGGAGFSFGDRVRELGLVSLATGELTAVKGDAIPWAYRSWNVEGSVVAWCVLELDRGLPSRLRERAREFFHRKRRTQPLAEASAGCIFKNPPGQAAAALIDRLGLKGLRRGGAEVSKRHANFIVNREGRARASDVRRLIAEIQERVEAAYGIRLEPEIVLAGETD